MIITLISQEKNLGILTLTDYLISNLGKDNVAVFGWNYLLPNYQRLLEQITEFSQTKNVIIKYITHKNHFTSTGVSYPKELNDLSDLILRVPTYKEEISNTVKLDIFKGSNHPLLEYIKTFYA